MSTFTTPIYPACLAPQYWDKKKGVFAKMAGETGVGVSLTKLKKTFESTDWKIIQIDDRVPKINVFQLPEWEKMCKEAAADGIKELGKLRLAAYETRDLAKLTAGKFRKNKLIPKESTALCEEIETAADRLGVSSNPNSVSGFVATAYKQGRAWLDLTVKLLEGGGLKKAIKADQDAVDGLKAPEDWKKAGIFTKTRNITQILGNAVKVANAGYPLGLDGTQCKKLVDQLAYYGNTTDQPFKDGDVKGLDEHKKKLGALLSIAERIKV